MYFNKERVLDVNQLVNKKYNIYAHKKEAIYEKLEEHINLSLKYFHIIFEKKNLENIFIKFEDEVCKEISKKGISIFREMIINTIALHDMGKVNPYFQKDRLGNDIGIKESGKFKNSHHSIISSIVYIQYYFNIIKKIEKPERDYLLHFMMMNAYVISRHHGELDSWEQFQDKFKGDGEGIKLLQECRILFEETLNMKINISLGNINKIFEFTKQSIENQEKDISIYKYIYVRLMLSLLVACDFYSTSEFMDGVEIKDIGLINNIDEFYSTYRDGEIYKFIRKYEKDHCDTKIDFSKVTDINVLRNELFLDAEKVLKENIDSNIFYLEAPTGSGKSNVATNLSFTLLEEDKSKNKIFYVYPFNTLVQQNISNLNKIFGVEQSIMDKIAVINSIEPIKCHRKIFCSEDTNIEYYKRALLNRQFLNYPMVLTTHVTIFKYLFGTSKEDIFPVHQLANSVIVLDEIQSYRNCIWSEIITFLSCYAKILNIKIIIMSATLPNLDELSLAEVHTVKLINDRKKYFNNPIFKDRVEVNYDLLQSEDIKEDLYNHVKEHINCNKKILIEFINKNSAYEFYHRLRDDDEVSIDVELISGDDNIAERNRIIDKIGNIKSIILVATQVVEAGVDIDMDIGYKNISMLDSEEQFLGRINRSCKKDKCVVFFFKLDDAKVVYKNDIRINKDITLMEDHIQNILKEKNFSDFYNEVMKRLMENKQEFNDDNIQDFFNNKVKDLYLKDVEEKMKLIQESDNKISVYLSSYLTADGETLCGDEIWEEYKSLLVNNKMEYAEKRVRLSKTISRMNNFIYEIKWSNNFTYNDRIGDLYYIEDGDSYFKDGKIDKEKFETGIGEFI